MHRTALSVALVVALFQMGGSTVDTRKEGQWCDVDVVVFEDDQNEGRVRGAWKGIFARMLSKFRSATAKKGADSRVSKVSKITLPPDTLAESKWIRGIPPATSSPTSPPTIDEIKSWHFDPLQYSAEALVPVFSTTMQYYDLPTKFNVSIDTLDGFASRMMEAHNPHAAYHNWHHGVSTVHMSFTLLALGGADEFLTDLDLFALLLAALIHDVDHAGHNNAFEARTKTPLAAKYANESILENNSVDVAYRELENCRGCDIFEGMKREGRTDEQYLILRLAKEFVLATDAADHGAMLKKLHTRTDDGTAWNKGDDESRSTLCKMIVHAADISNPASPDFVVARDWCLRISNEFYRQAEAERRLGLEVTEFMDGLTNEYKIAKQQQGFYTWMALPLFEVVGSLLPKASVLEGWGRQNLQHFTDIVGATDEWNGKQSVEL